MTTTHDDDKQVDELRLAIHAEIEAIQEYVADMGDGPIKDLRRALDELHQVRVNIARIG